jgi:hypothetical protein
VTDGLMRGASREELAAVVANLLAAHLTGATAGSLCDAEALMLTKDPGPMLAVLERVLTGEHRIAGAQLARHAGTALAPGCERDPDAARLAAFRALASEGPPAASAS